MTCGYVYLVITDNGFDFGSPNHIETIDGIYTEEAFAQLALYDNGFTERDSVGRFWRGPECGWIERHELHDSYCSGRER